jgi:glycosyltransferase involved in cell wall biosynthesis
MISDVYFPRINGVSTSIQTFRNDFITKGHHVTLIAPRYNDVNDTEDWVIRIDARQLPFDPEDRMMKFKDIVTLIPRLKTEAYDLIHIHTPFIAHYAGVKISKALNIPSIVTYHTLFEEYLFHYIPILPKRFLRAFARHFSRSQCNQVKSIVAPSSIIFDLLRNYGVHQPIKIIPTGINTDHFKNGDGNRFRNQYAIPLHKKILLTVSRVAFEKNIHLLIDAVCAIKDQLPDIYLVIAGEGPAKKTYMQHVQKLGLGDYVQFVGYLDRGNELIDCYHAADVFVFSSKTETQGLVLLEAMAAGIPVVSVAEMGTKDILTKCPAAIIALDTVEDFCLKIVTLFRDHSSLQQLHKHTISYAQLWDSSIIANKMLEYYQTISEG